MNKIAKGFLFAAAAVVSIVVLILFGMGIYIESAGVQARLEAALSQELKMPVRASRMRLSPWGKLKVEDLAVAEGLEPLPEGEPQPTKEREIPGDAFFHSPLVSARLAWKPLLAGRFVIRELVITQPTVQWAQSEKGRWSLPRLQEEKQPLPAPAQEPVEPEEVVEAKAPPEAIAPEPSQPASEKPTDKKKTAKKPKKQREKSPREPKKKIEFQVVAARIENASFRFYDRKRRPLAVFEGVNFDCPSTSAHRAEGTAVIRSVTLHDGVTLENLSTPYLFENGTLSLPKIEAELAGGAVNGLFLLHAEEDGAPFQLDVQFDKVDLGRLLNEARADLSGQKVQGAIAGSLKLEGESGREKSIVGGGEVVLAGGRMEHNPLFQMIGQALQIDELTRLDLKQSRLDFRVKNARVHVDPLLIESENLSLRSEGSVRFNGKLDLQASLAVNSRISRQFPKWLMSNFKPLADADRQELRFKIRGTLDNPDTDLMRVLVGQRLEKQALELLRVFRSSPKEKKKGKKDEDELH